MIWGWYGAPGDVVPVSVNFEVMEPPEYLPELGEVASGEIRNFALSELTSFELQPQLSSEMSYLTLFTLGVAEYVAKDWNATIGLLNAAVEGLDSSNDLDLSLAFFYEGNAHLFIDSLEAAITAYDAALNINPDSHEALNNKGNALYELGQYEAAIAAYDAALALEPNLPFAYGGLAYAYTALNQKEQAIDSLEKFLEISPDFDRQQLDNIEELEALSNHPRFRAIVDAPQ